MPIKLYINIRTALVQFANSQLMHNPWIGNLYNRYPKILKAGTVLRITIFLIVLMAEKWRSYNAVMHSKDAHGMANSVDPD